MYARIQMSTDKQSFSDAALVVENIVENLDVKRAFWAEISPHGQPGGFARHQRQQPDDLYKRRRQDRHRHPQPQDRTAGEQGGDHGAESGLCPQPSRQVSGNLKR